LLKRSEDTLFTCLLQARPVFLVTASRLYEKLWNQDEEAPAPTSNGRVR
jgi:hypothetical protein